MITNCDNIPQIKGWISRIVNNTYYARFDISINDKNSGRLLHLLPDCKKRRENGYNPNWSRAIPIQAAGRAWPGLGDHGPRCVADPRREAAPGWPPPPPPRRKKGVRVARKVPVYTTHPPDMIFEFCLCVCLCLFIGVCIVFVWACKCKCIVLGAAEKVGQGSFWFRLKNIRSPSGDLGKYTALWFTYLLNR